MDFWGKITACNREKEEKEKEQQQPPTSDRLFSFSFSSSSPASYHHQQQQQQPYFPPPPYHHHHNELGEPSTNYEEEGGGGIGRMLVEREHMFDKVVTPSDVGKLNRLVIPKQHAERFFPLDSSNNDKGLQLNFEDRNGKVWRFRYSYWNSSQSYVMTKGWSRFVKEKKLDAGDIVSFQRGVGITPKDRLFIDWRRRVSHGVSSPPLSFSFHPWNPLVLKSHPAFPRRNNLMLPPSDLGMGNYTGGGSRSVIFFRPPPESTSTPPVSGKRLRLFGVNMDCPFSDEHELDRPSSPTPPCSSNIPYLQLSPYGEASSSADHAFEIIGKSTGSSMSLDLEI